MSRASRYTIITAALIAVSPASAHHSDAGIDMESVIAFEGTVTEFAWRNPHVYALVQVTGDGGEAVEWDLQMGPTNVLFRRGWRRDTLQPRDLVAVRAHAAVSGRAYGIIESIDTAASVSWRHPALRRLRRRLPRFPANGSRTVRRR